MNFSSNANTTPSTGCEVLKIPDTGTNMQPVPTSGSLVPQDTGARVLPVFYIQGTAPPVRVAPSTIGPQKVSNAGRPTLVTTSTQFLPTLAPKLGMTSTVVPANPKATVIPQQQQQQQQHFMIQTTRPAGPAGNTSPVKNRAFAYLGTFIRPGVVKPGESSQKLLLANVPLPLSTANSASSTAQQPKMASLLVPMTIPTQVNSSKGSVINLKIANRHVHSDGKSSVAVLREAKPVASNISQLPPLQPISKHLVPKSINSNAAPDSSPHAPVKERSITPNATTVMKKVVLDADSEMKRNSFPASDDKRRRSQDLNRCLKEAVDAIFAPNSPSFNNESSKEKDIDDEVTLIKVMTSRNEEPKKELPEDDVKIEIVKPGVKQEIEIHKDVKIKTAVKIRKPEIKTEVDLVKNDSCVENNLDSVQEKVDTKPEIKVDQETSDSKVSFESPEAACEDFDPMKVLEWKDGIGTLPGSDLKFRMNEFDMMEMVDDEDYAKILSSKSNFESEKTEGLADKGLLVNAEKELQEANTPSETSEKKEANNKPSSTSDEIYCCEGCGCYGLATEFVSNLYCSPACEKVQVSKKAAETKKERELLQLRLRRRRKRLLQLLELQKAQELHEKAMQQQQTGQANPSATPAATVSEEDNISNEGTQDPGKVRLPWQTGKSGFSWTKYLDHCKAKAAPVKLFKDPFPYCKNGFKIGMKMEGIDPEHPAYYCVLTVADVQGYRIRLTFDGYPESHDFWVNADSMDIFPAGWCERNNHQLHPPRGYKHPFFNWSTYLKQCRAQAAPRNLFSNKTGSSICPNGFRLGMKLEAVDRKNSSLVCVATVADLMDSRILVHFDSWGDIYDYWADPASPYIHPVGWCEEHGHVLTPPVHYKPPQSFSWEQYLKETKSQAAPARAFKQRPPCGFRRGMKLECVDKRVPMLIRVATVDDVLDHQIKIRFDGWPDEYSYWLDDDSPDIHPVGWCQKTAHPLESPLTSEDLLETSECPTPGCQGKGHIKGPKYGNHHTTAGCPYAPENLTKESLVPDRLFAERGMGLAVANFSFKQKDIHRYTWEGRGTREKVELLVATVKTPGDKDDSTGNQLPENRNPVGRPPRCRRVDSREDKMKHEDPDWSIEEDHSGGKKKGICEKDEPGVSSSQPQKSDGRQTTGRASKRRVENTSDKVDDADWSAGNELSSVKRKRSNCCEDQSTCACARGPGQYRNVPNYRQLRMELRESILRPGYEPNLNQFSSCLWAKHSRYLNEYIRHFKPDEITKWSCDDVVKFIKTIPGCEDVAHKFKEEDIDGDVLLMLGQQDFVRVMKMKLGPAVKLYNSIVLLRQLVQRG